MYGKLKSMIIEYSLCMGGYGLWSEHGAWSMEHGAWSMKHDAVF
jgi:hypothetical protein